MVLMLIWYFGMIASITCSSLHTTITSEEQHSLSSSNYLTNFHPNGFTYAHELSSDISPKPSLTYRIIKNGSDHEESIIYESPSKIHLHASNQDMNLLVLYEDCCFGIMSTLSLLNLTSDSRMTLNWGWSLNIKTLSFSANGKYLLVHSNRNIDIWNSLTGHRTLVIPFDPLLASIGNHFIAHYDTGKLVVKSLKRSFEEVSINITAVNRIFLSKKFVIVGTESSIKVFSAPTMERRLSLSVKDILINDAVINDSKLFLATTDGVFGVYNLEGCEKLFSVRLHHSIHSARFRNNRLSVRIFNHTKSSYKTLTYYYYSQTRAVETIHDILPLPKEITKMIMDYSRQGYDQNIYQLPENIVNVYIDNQNIVFSIKNDNMLSFSSYPLCSGVRQKIFTNICLKDFDFERVVKVGDAVIGLLQSGDLAIRSVDGQDLTVLKNVKHFDVLASRMVTAQENVLSLYTSKGECLWTRMIDDKITAVLLDSDRIFVRSSSNIFRYDFQGDNQKVPELIPTNSTPQMTLEEIAIKSHDTRWQTILEASGIDLDDVKMVRFIGGKLVILTETAWSVIEVWD